MPGGARRLKRESRRAEKSAARLANEEERDRTIQIGEDSIAVNAILDEEISSRDPGNGTSLIDNENPFTGSLLFNELPHGHQIILREIAYGMGKDDTSEVDGLVSQALNEKISMSHITEALIEGLHRGFKERGG